MRYSVQIGGHIDKRSKSVSPLSDIEESERNINVNKIIKQTFKNYANNKVTQYKALDVEGLITRNGKIISNSL